MSCPSCGAENREGARFCDACGASQDLARASGSRRTVTILFADISGSTELGERLDPERLRHVLSRYFDAMRAVIERHGGTVEKFIGDAVMAVFGIPRVHEDDALRAVRAASEIGEALDEINDELEPAHGVRIRMRTGVNTGEVVVDDGAGGESLVTGDAVNVAARFEQAAGPGEVVIGEETFLLVRDAILAEPMELLSLKGKAEPVVAYRLKKVDPNAAGFARRLDAPMVGRDRELSLLRGAFERALSDHACQLFTVLGVGGVGKSRLLAAFVDELGDRATVLRGRCLPYGDGITFWPVVEAVGQVAGFSEVDDPEGSIARITALIPDDEHAVRIARQISQVIGVSGSNAAPEETLWAIRRLLEGMARVHPVVFMIDDIQWAEPTMLELIEYIAEWSVDSPILLACMARPELLETKPAWSGGKLNATSISLEPLSTEECETLIANLLAIERVDPAVRERVAAAAEGHPLFAEEMLAMLVDEGRIVREEGEWVASGDLSDLAVPPTTSALLAARIDRLGTGERATLERASVMGQVFYREALVRLAGDDDVGPSLTALVRKQFVRPERSDMPDVEALVFRHLLIRDAAYEGITKTDRADLHERFADWLESRAPEQHELIGYHLESAYGYLTELGDEAGRASGIGERASGFLAVAGDRAFDRADVEATINLLTRALALMPPNSPARISPLIDLGNALIERGSLADGNAALDEAVAVSAAGTDQTVAARTRMARLQLRMWGHMEQSEVRAAEAEAEEAITLLERLGDDLGTAWAIAFLGGRSWNECRALETGDRWRRAVDLFRRAGDDNRANEWLSWLASVSVWGPIPCVIALAELERLTEEAGGSLMTEAEIADSSATTLWMLGEFDEARRRYDRAHRLRLELGRRVADAHGSQTRGWLELMAGDAVAAEQILGSAAEALAAIGSDGLTIITAMHAHALYDLGRYDEADAAAARGFDLTRSDLASDCLSLSVRAKVAARRGAFEHAESLAREAIEMMEHGDFINDQADARMAFAEVLELAGRGDEAIEAAREALDRYEAKGNLTQAGMARARLADLAG